MSDLRIRLVVLDWAGTCLDFGGRAVAEALTAAFADRGMVLGPTAARAAAGLPVADQARAALAALAPDRTDAAEVAADVAARLPAAIADHAELVSGLVEAVAHLRANGVAVAVATELPRAASDAAARAAERQGFKPDAVVCADDVPAGRPAPWAVYRAMERAGVFPPPAVAVVGGTRPGLAAALNAAVWAAGVLDSAPALGLTAGEFGALADWQVAERRTKVLEAFRAAGAHAVLPTAADLPALVADLNRRLAAGERTG